MIYLDTHVVVWLFASGTQNLSEKALKLIETVDDLRISPMVRLELQYLREIDRITTSPATIIDELIAAIGLRVCDHSFPLVAKEAETHQWTRDPFDRIIVAQAAVKGAELISKDQRILEHYRLAQW